MCASSINTENGKRDMTNSRERLRLGSVIVIFQVSDECYFIFIKPALEYCWFVMLQISLVSYFLVFPLRFKTKFYYCTATCIAIRKERLTSFNKISKQMSTSLHDSRNLVWVSFCHQPWIKKKRDINDCLSPRTGSTSPLGPLEWRSRHYELFCTEFS